MPVSIEVIVRALLSASHETCAPLEKDAAPQMARRELAAPGVFTPDPKARSNMRRVPSWLAGAVVLVVAACGDSTPAGTGAATCTPGTTASMGITASGVSPKAVCVLPGGTVTFTNSTADQHEIEVDSPCSATNGGTIVAGATRTLTFPSAQICTFRDPTVAAGVAATFVGTVAVTTATVGGGGGGGAGY